MSQFRKHKDEDPGTSKSHDKLTTKETLEMIKCRSLQILCQSDSVPLIILDCLFSGNFKEKLGKMTMEIFGQGLFGLNWTIRVVCSQYHIIDSLDHESALSGLLAQGSRCCSSQGLQILIYQFTMPPEPEFYQWALSKRTNFHPTKTPKTDITSTSKIGSSHFHQETRGSTLSLQVEQA